MEKFESIPEGPHTRLQPDGSMIGGEYHILKQQDGSETAFLLGESSEKEQFIVSQIASLILNVANVFPYKTEDGVQRFLSPNTRDQFNYDESKTVCQEDRLLFGLLFGDMDHMENKNHEGGVFFDFDTSDTAMSEEDFLDQPRTGHERTLFYLDRDKKYNNIDIEYMKNKCNELLSHISGESGLQFIIALCKKSNFDIVTPEQIQQRILKNLQMTLEKLS